LRGTTKLKNSVLGKVKAEGTIFVLKEGEEEETPTKENNAHTVTR